MYVFFIAFLITNFTPNLHNYLLNTKMIMFIPKQNKAKNDIKDL